MIFTASALRDLYHSSSCSENMSCARTAPDASLLSRSSWMSAASLGKRASLPTFFSAMFSNGTVSSIPQRSATRMSRSLQQGASFAYLRDIPDPISSMGGFLNPNMFFFIVSAMAV